MCAVFAAQAQTKVAHINSSELLEMLPETDSIQAKLVQTQEMWQNLLLEKENQAKLKYAELMKVIDDPSVDDGLKEYKTQEVESLQQQYQELQQNAQAALSKKQQELYTPLLDKVKKVIGEVAKANGYAYVMDTTEGSGIIYSDASFDLMPLVKAKLGLK